ncbi:O-antigen ligase family protein [Paenibacillus hamazuiensis]|uniref:O-antigen ligase family protein n=1 Tax=Paenibacillus hamazuiensis TaxID=2936508 RepID=UPI00201062E6|nr:O-antigen ligase family protein [Paenibacillus hamazuiensis]
MAFENQNNKNNFVIPFLLALSIGLDGISLGSIGGGNLRLSYILIPVMFLIIIFQYDLSSSLKKDFKTFLISFIFVFYCLLSIFWAPSLNESIYNIIRLINGYLYFIIAWSLKFNRRSLLVFLTTISLIQALDVIRRFIMLLPLILSGTSANIVVQKISTMSSYAIQNSNAAAVVAGFGTIIAMYYLKKINNNDESYGYKRIFWLFIAGITSISIIFALSRTAILGVLIGLIIIYRSRIILISSGIMLFLLVLMLINNDIYSLFIGKIMYSESINNRIGLAKIALDLYLNSPIIGNGIGAITALFPYLNDIEVGNSYAHNLYLTIAAQLGTIGLLLFLILVVRIIKLRLIERDILGLALIGMLVSKAIFLFDLSEEYIWIIIAYCSISYKERRDCLN